MRYPAFSIAKRYLFSRKSTRVVNIISMITAFAMAVGASALIIVMSTFNGFEDLVKSLYKVFYTDLVIQPAEGKFFDTDEDILKTLDETTEILNYSLVVEENVLAQFADKQAIVTIKGVDGNYFNVVDDLQYYMYSGGMEFSYNKVPAAILGAGVAYTLGVNTSMPNTYLTLHMPRSDRSAFNDLANAFRSDNVYAGGVFAVQQDFDNKYIITSLNFAQSLMNLSGKASAIELKINEKVNVKKLKENLQNQLGQQFIIKTRHEQNETLYKVMQTEKWAVFAILSFILLIAAFNIIGSLSMLVIDKKQDIATLRSLGANKQLIRNIFLIEGLLISLLGAFTGLILGTIVCWIQMKFGLIKMPGASFMIDAYPVKLMWQDLAFIVTVIVSISLLMAWLPAHRAVKQSTSLSPNRY